MSIAFPAMGLALVVVGVIVIANPRGRGQRWMEHRYVYGPSKADGSDRTFEQAVRRFRIMALVSIAIGVWITWTGLSDLFSS
jgi:uncharacterized protein YjeT (DUF2065 family)